jgi:hypothetical protein
MSPFAALLSRKSSPRSIQGQGEQFLKTLRREPFSPKDDPLARSSDPPSLVDPRLRAVVVRAVLDIAIMRARSHKSRRTAASALPQLEVKQMVAGLAR